MKNNYQTVDEILNNKFGKKKTTKPVIATKVKKVKPKKEKTKKSKKFIVGMVALITAGAIALGAGIAHLTSIFKKKNNDVPTKPTTSISAMDLDDMGTELEFPQETTPTYGETTGNINVDDLTEKDGKIYKDKENADKSNNVGNEKVDTKNDTLIVEDGKVKDPNEGYEIKNEQGEVIDQGDLNEDKLPDGFEYNENIDGIFEEEDNTSNLVYADSDYYDKEGNLVLAKGDLVEKDRLEYAKKHYYTTKPVTQQSTETTKPAESTKPAETTPATEPTTEATEPQNEGVVNADGTYTIFGVTYADKATFEQIALSDLETLDMYLDENGVLHIKTEELENQLTKTK